MDQETPAPAGKVTLELAYNLLRMLFLAAVVVGVTLAGNRTGREFRRHYLPSELFVDSGRVIFIQPDGSLTAIDIADGTVLKRLFADKAGPRADVHTIFLTDNDKLIADAAGQTLVLDRKSLELRSAAGTPAPSRRHPFESGDRYGDVYDGPETPEYAGRLSEAEWRELGLTPVAEREMAEPVSVFPGGFVFSHLGRYYEETGKSLYRVFYADRSGSWSGDVSHIARDWHNRVDRVHITDGEILMAATNGQLECLDRRTGRSRWLYLFPTRRWALGVERWNLMAPGSFYTTEKWWYDRELRDIWRGGTVPDGADAVPAFAATSDPQPTDFYFWRSVLAFAVVYIPLAALLLFLAHAALALRRRTAPDERVGLFAAGPAFSLFTTGWRCIFLSFAVGLLLICYFHVSWLASRLLVLAGIASWVLGACLFVASRGEKRDLRDRIVGWVLAAFWAALSGWFITQRF